MTKRSVFAIGSCILLGEALGWPRQAARRRAASSTITLAPRHGREAVPA
jgi:hypothetical protein